MTMPFAVDGGFDLADIYPLLMHIVLPSA